MHHEYTYEDAIAASQRINWRVEDLIGGDKELDFGKPFLPESLARTQPLGFLTGEERRTLNQIRGHGYLHIFGLVEEFILPFVIDHVRERLDGDDYRTRAFLGFATEEAKHIDLFKRFRREFCAGFRTECAVIGPPADIARAVLSHDPLAVALAILQIEWMTQRHYVESVKNDHDLDPQFKAETGGQASELTGVLHHDILCKPRRGPRIHDPKSQVGILSEVQARPSVIKRRVVAAQCCECLFPDEEVTGNEGMSFTRLEPSHTHIRVRIDRPSLDKNNTLIGEVRCSILQPVGADLNVILGKGDHLSTGVAHAQVPCCRGTAVLFPENPHCKGPPV